MPLIWGLPAALHLFRWQSQPLIEVKHEQKTLFSLRFCREEAKAEEGMLPWE